MGCLVLEDGGIERKIAEVEMDIAKAKSEGYCGGMRLVLVPVPRVLTERSSLPSFEFTLALAHIKNTTRAPLGVPSCLHLEYFS